MDKRIKKNNLLRKIGRKECEKKDRTELKRKNGKSGNWTEKMMLTKMKIFK
jgi:hypothetical protein